VAGFDGMGGIKGRRGRSGARCRAERLEAVMILQITSAAL